MAALNSTMKKLRIALLSVAFWGGSAPAQMNYKIVEKDKTDELAAYQFVISADQCNKDALLHLSHEYARQHSRLKFLYLGFYVDRATAMDARGKGMFDFTYEVWKVRFEAREKKPSFCTAEFLKYGSGAALRIRYPDARIEGSVVEGDNLFHPTIDGVDLKLLHLTCVRQGFGVGKKLVPILYFSVPRKITEQEAETISRSILQASNLSSIKILLGEDQWFVFDSYYPWLNPFGPPASLPTKLEIAQSQEFLCRPAEETICYRTSAKP